MDAIPIVRPLFRPRPSLLLSCIGNKIAGEAYLLFVVLYQSLFN